MQLICAFVLACAKNQIFIMLRLKFHRKNENKTLFYSENIFFSIIKMVTKDNKDDRKRAEKALEAAGFKVAKVTTVFK